jgi:hypothetical protein
LHAQAHDDFLRFRIGRDSTRRSIAYSREVLAGPYNDLVEGGASNLSARNGRSSKTLQASARTGC